MKKIKGIEQLCGYGCGNVAKFPPKRGMRKWCCEEHYNKCLGKKKDPWNKGKCGVYSSETLSLMKEKAGHHIKGKTYEQIHGKEKASLLRKQKSERMSVWNKGREPWNKDFKGCHTPEVLRIIKEKAKQRMENPLNRIKIAETLRKRISDDIKESFDKYSQEVWFLTEDNVKLYSDKIENLCFRSIDFHLDHKFSIKEGFVNQISPMIIASCINLEIIPAEENIKKYTSCSISKNELLEEYNNEINS